MKEFYIENGKTVYVGNNDKENFILIDKCINYKHSLWFHLKHFPSCHVFLVTNLNNEFTKSDIITASNYCKMYTKYKNINKITVEYIDLLYVKKTNIIGKVTLQHKPNYIVV